MDRVCGACGGIVLIFHVGNPCSEQEDERCVRIRIVVAATPLGRNLECTFVHGPDVVSI